MAFLTTHAEIEELGGGRCRQTIGLKPIAYRRNGNLTRILNSLANTGDPNLPLGVSELADFRVRDRLAGNSPMAHFGRGQSHIRWTWLGTNNVNGQPSGNVQLFPGAWAGADVRMAIAGHILHDDVLLETGHPRSFALRLDAHQNFDLATLSSAEFRVLDPVLLGPVGQVIPLVWQKSVQGDKTILTVTLPPGDFASWTLDPTLTLQPDGTDGLDTYSTDGGPTINHGTENVIGVGQHKTNNDIYRSWIKFSGLSLPAGAVISSTTLSLFLSDAGNTYATNNRTLRIYRTKRAWVEAQAAWNIYSTGNNWQTAGGFGANDCEQTDIGSLAFATTDASGAQKDFALTGTTTAALDLGNGWMLKADTETSDLYGICSSDHATAANRPKLTVVYTVPGGYVPILSRRRL